MVCKATLFALMLCVAGGYGFSVGNQDRRAFISKITSTGIAIGGVAAAGVSPALAGPEILKLSSGIKYAITKPSEKGQYPESGDIVAIEYTGYLSSGQVSWRKVL